MSDVLTTELLESLRLGLGPHKQEYYLIIGELWAIEQFLELRDPIFREKQHILLTPQAETYLKENYSESE